MPKTISMWRVWTFDFTDRMLLIRTPLFIIYLAYWNPCFNMNAIEGGVSFCLWPLQWRIGMFDLIPYLWAPEWMIRKSLYEIRLCGKGLNGYA